MADIGIGMMPAEPPPDQVIDGQGMITWNDDGTIDVADHGPAPVTTDPNEHGTNLADHLSDSDLGRVADDLIEAYERDKKAREPWELRLNEGLEIVGYLKENDEKVPFRGASSAVYPLIAEAVTQFNARAMDELFPAAGPVKTIVVGEKTSDKEQQAERVEDYMNYQITEEDPGWQDEDDRLLARLPIDGMGWKKVYRDERLGIATSRFVPASDIFCPYNATSMHSLPRLCHRYPVRYNDLRFEQLAGNWRDIDLQEPTRTDADESPAQASIDEAEGTQAPDDEDMRAAQVHTILEFYVDYDLPGFEHVSDATGRPTGLALPYIVTIELDSRKVLAIFRNWREGDERYRKRLPLTPFRFLPGLGFYGFGFLHVIGSLNQAATGALRGLLDSAARQNSQGGFVSNDARMKVDESLTIGQGEWKAVNLSADELRNAFFAPPWHPPSEALFKLLGILIEAGKSYTGTTEAMTGSAPTTGPVGTLVALIEQGSKVFSGIHKRLHKAKRDEYRLLAELNAEHIPPEGYPYDVGGIKGQPGMPGADRRMVYAKDFGPAVDVLPVSDPNIYSTHQKIAIAQAVLDLSERHPDMVDPREAIKRMMEAMKVPAIDQVMPDKTEKPHRDPIAENMLMLTGQPATAFPDQRHDAHLAVHQAFMANPGYGAAPDVVKVVGPLMASHVAEHLAYQYQQQVMQLTGIPYVPVDASSIGNEENAPEMPPQMQEQIAVRAAMASQELIRLPGMPQLPQGPDPAQVKAQAAIATTQAQIEAKKAEIGIKQAGFQADQAQKEQAFQAEQARQGASWEIDQRRLEEAHQEALRQQREAADAQAEAMRTKAEGQADAARVKARAKPEAK